MKNEDIPGYTELRNKLFQIRYELQLTKSDEERTLIKEELKNVRREMAKLLFEHSQELRKKGR